mgnify:CR=1 FL=1
MGERFIDRLAYSIREACEVSSLGKTTIYGHIKAGRLDAVRVGGRTLIPAESLKQLLNGGSQHVGG